MSFLSIRNLTKRYGAVDALMGFDLDLDVGAHLAVVGPSGSGKTTFLRLLGGFEDPDGGEIHLDGRPLATADAGTPPHRRSIGYVAQEGALFPHLSVAGNVLFGLPRAAPDRAARLRTLMDMVELPHDMSERRPHELSGGQQQRVALARSLAREPRLMLLDEPFSALDAGLRNTTRETVQRVLRNAGIATILVTHDRDEALSFADKIAVLKAGRLVQAGAPRDLYFAPADRHTAAFLGDAIILPAEIANGVADCALGRVAVDHTEMDGRRDILLRPEQIGFFPPGETTGLRQADVIDVEFGGAHCMVRIRLDVPGAPQLHIRIRGHSMDVPVLSGPVAIGLRGVAHVFQAGASVA